MRRVSAVVVAISLSLFVASPTSAQGVVTKAFGTCVELKLKYKGGVANSRVIASKNKAFFSPSVYKLNKALDTNKNGIACDKNDLDNPFGGRAQEDFLMPNVVCLDLQAAQDAIQDHGVFYSKSVDASGQGRLQLIDRNWIVIGQSPKPGKKITEGSAVLKVVKFGESTRGLCK